jgi:hypothetical protein
MNAAAILQILNAALGLTSALRSFGVNYREVLDAQDAADAAGVPLSPEVIQGFVDQAQKAIDDL